MRHQIDPDDQWAVAQDFYRKYAVGKRIKRRFETWKEFKDLVEFLGVMDGDEIDSIEVFKGDKLCVKRSDNGIAIE